MDKKWYIEINGEQISVTEEIYRAYKRPLWKARSALSAEKKRIEDATGVTTAGEREEQRKRNKVIRQQQERYRRNTERQAE